MNGHGRGVGMKNVMFASITTDFEKSLAEIFTREGYGVCNAQTLEETFAQPIEYLIDTTDYRDVLDTFTLTEGINATMIEQVLRKNVFTSMALLERFLPLLDAGLEKRLFYISSAMASMNETFDTKGYAYKMAKAALHQFLQMTWTKLTPSGYTLRLFDPMCGDVPPQQAAASAFYYITRRRGMENDDGRRDDENNLIMRDALGRVHGW